MRRTTYLYLLLTGLILSIGACKSANDESETDSGQEELIALEKEVIAIHDEVMPKMGHISQLKTELEKAAENAALEEKVQLQIAQSIQNLELGDSLMWEWMHNYAKPESAPADSVKLYLENEKIRINRVSETMLTSIKNAESLLQQLGHGQPH